MVWRQEAFPKNRLHQLFHMDGLFSSYQNALDDLRQRTCQEYDGVWLCHDIEEFPFYPGYDGWIWGYRFCRPYEPGYCSWHAASRLGICPGNLTGYHIKDIYDVDRYGFIACPIPSYPDGEKISQSLMNVEKGRLIRFILHLDAKN